MSLCRFPSNRRIQVFRFIKGRSVDVHKAVCEADGISRQTNSALYIDNISEVKQYGSSSLNVVAVKDAEPDKHAARHVIGLHGGGGNIPYNHDLGKQ